MEAHLAGEPSTVVRRLPEKAVGDRAVLDAVLDADCVGHVALVDGEWPYAIATGYARDGDRILLHGSSASRLFRIMASGAPICFTVTILDGMVYSRSAFESSMTYRSVMVFGHGEALRGAAKLAALHVMTERMLPGRWEDIRAPKQKELAATLVVALPLERWSVKIADGYPGDDPDDLGSPVWAGIVPLTRVLQTPVDAPDLTAGTPVPDYVRTRRTL